MNPAIRLAEGLGAAGVVALAVGLGCWFRRWRRKDPAELERLRRLAVNRSGRITVARVVDFEDAKGPQHNSRLVFYTYEVSGVTYEAAQDVFGIPDLNLKMADLAGQVASVKYDTKKPTNSIIACEGWSGLPDFQALRNLRARKSNEQAARAQAADSKPTTDA